MQIKQTPVSRKEFVTDFIRLFKNEVKEVTNKDFQEYLLPPGSSSFENFLEKCTQCYDCISVCPNESIRVMHDIDLAVNEYPVIMPKENPCYLCEDFPCIDACKTDALTIENSHNPLGAIGIIKENCFSYQDHFCSSCINNCPKAGLAIYADEKGHPIINKNECDGCGICINVCPSDKPAIRILKKRN